MSAQAPGFSTAPSDEKTPQQDRGIFNEEHKKHESHHYMRTYGGKVVNAALFGFGATLGADAANGAVGEMKGRLLVPFILRFVGRAGRERLSVSCRLE